MSSAQLIAEAEEQLVELVLDKVTETVADRGGNGYHSPPWLPKRNVKVGVLRPRIVLDQGARSLDEESDDEGLADEQALSDPDVIGVDFVLKGETESAPLHLNVSARVVFYQPLYPTLAEARRLAASEDDDGSGNSDGTKQIQLQSAWQRYVVEVEDLDIELPVTGEHVSTNGRLNEAIATEVDRHFASKDAARPFGGGRQVVTINELRDENTYRSKLKTAGDPNWEPTHPQCELVAFSEELPDGTRLVSVTLQNSGVVAGDYVQDLTFYDCGISVEPGAGYSVQPLKFDLAPNDYRYRDIALEPGHGRRAVAIATDTGVATETLPRHYMKTMVPRTDHVPALRWEELARNPWPILDQVGASMRRYLGEWDEWLNAQEDPVVEAESRGDRDGFKAEIDAFELGLEALRTDDRLLDAFKLANETFAEANRDKPYDSWRLFQLVYITMHLPALAARSHRSRTDFASQLDYVDVLWFPTGGGKTEAYLGLILTAAFYDRLRGKKEGVTAWLKFPLRMLSVQQLSRVLRVIVFAEELRTSRIPDGVPFELGYLVGSGNTPNEVMYSNGWWPGMSAAVSEHATNPTALDEHRLVGECPYCGHSEVCLEPDAGAYRIRHICRRCEKYLPIHLSDTEVFRYQPTVVVSTIDKITGFAFFGEFTSFSLGPKKKCPRHGYFAFGECPVRSERDESLKCDEPDTNYEDAEFYDPVPSLTIQDELHLVREELGAFDSHFESLIAYLQRTGPSQMPTKVLGATATIEQFEDQLRQVYGRMPRRFPSPGYVLGHSFYVTTEPNLRRVYLGIMPSGGKTAKVEVAGQAQAALIETVHHWQNDPSAVYKLAKEKGHGALANLSPDELISMLFNYEVSLGFVNSKAHGTLIASEITGLSDRLESSDEDRVHAAMLTGQVDVPELASAISQVERATSADPRAGRLRAIVGTSVVSHGVDLERLNLMVMAGLPSTTADYIQATSRSGRIHVGVVITVYDDFQRREASSFTHFGSTHRMLDVLVEPVPVNRFAKRAVDRTLPSIVMAILWQLARDPNLGAPVQGIKYTRNFQKWWNANGGAIKAELEQALDQAYRSPVHGLNPPDLENKLAEAAVEIWEQLQSPAVRKFDADRTTDLFRDPGIMTSLRDVEAGVNFDSFGWSSELYEHMFPERVGP